VIAETVHDMKVRYKIVVRDLDEAKKKYAGALTEKKTMISKLEKSLESANAYVSL
jgi:predicted DNA-binding protein (UPF0251 family)